MASSVIMQQKFSNVRKKLDQLGYRQPLGLDSLPLAERLLSDLVWTTESLRKTKSELDQRMEVRGKVEECIEPYKADNAKLVRENNDLHQRNMALIQEKEEAIRELRSQIRRSQGENDDLKFFNTQCLNKIKWFEKEVKSMAEKIVFLQEKNFQAVVHTPGGRKKNIPFRRQRMDIDCSLPSNNNDSKKFCCVVARAWAKESRLQGDPELLEVVDVAGTRCEDLSAKVNRLQEELELASRKVDNFRKMVELRDSEIQRLNSMMEGGRPLEAVCQESKQRSNDRIITQLNLQMDLLQQRNDELEKQLLERIEKEREIENFHEKNVLKGEFEAEEEKLRQKYQEIEEASKKLEGIKEEAKSLEEEKEHLKKDLVEIKNHVTAQDKSKRKIQKSSREDLEELVDKLQTDKENLCRRIDKLASNERDFILEMERLRRVNAYQEVAEETSADTKINRMEVYMKGIEEDRDFWRSEAQTMTKLLRQHQDELATLKAERFPGRNGTRPCSTLPNKKSSTVSKKEKALENQVRLLQDECDHLKHQLQVIRIGAVKDKSRVSKGDDENDLNEELKAVKEERDSLQKLLDNFERQIHDIQGNIRVLTQERDSINKLYEDTRTELHRVRQELISNPKPSKVSLAAQSVLRRIETERDDALNDLRRMTTERDSLKERLRTSSETALNDKARLEQQLEDARGAVKRANIEKEESSSRLVQLRQRLSSLEEENKLMSNQLKERTSKAEEEHVSSEHYRLQSESYHSRLEQLERQCHQVQSEKQEAEDRIKILQDRIANLEKDLKSQREDCARLRSTVSQLDSEKDGLQNAVDGRAEQLSRLESELSHREQLISELRASVTTAEQQVSRAAEAGAAKEREIRNLKKQVDQQQNDLSQEKRKAEEFRLENGRLQDDLTTMTRENQALQVQLQDIAEEKESGRLRTQELANKLSVSEEQRTFKEQERASLLEQYRLLSMEAERYHAESDQLTSELNSVKMELLARDQELKHLKENLAAAEEEISEQREALASYESQVSHLTRTNRDLETQVCFSDKEKTEIISDVKALRDLCSRLESSKEQLQRQVTNLSMEIEQSRAQQEDANQEILSLKQQLESEETNCKNLETILTASREKEFQSQLDAQERTSELNMLKDRLELNDTKIDQQQRELTRLRTRNAELESDIERLHRQLTSEKFEKERAVQEMRRYQQQQTTTAALLSGSSTSLYRTSTSQNNNLIGGVASSYSPTTQLHEHRTDGSGDTL